MFDQLGALGDLGKWKNVFEASGLEVSDLTEVIGDLKDCKKAEDVVTVLKNADVDFDAQAVLKAVNETGVLDDAKDKLGGLFG